jgi:hypothetical protein
MPTGIFEELEASEIVIQPLFFGQCLLLLPLDHGNCEDLAPWGKRSLEPHGDEGSFHAQQRGKASPRVFPSRGGRCFNGRLTLGEIGEIPRDYPGLFQIVKVER